MPQCFKLYSINKNLSFKDLFSYFCLDVFSSLLQNVLNMWKRVMFPLEHDNNKKDMHGLDKLPH